MAALEDSEEQQRLCKGSAAADPFGNIRKQLSSEVSTSGDELIAKVRKPYTITKQRERWTEEEHHKFLEALKLYGRAWRKIEEHVGSKTAVQIRSHAQKFFSKLEREQASGVSAGKSPGIDIPPPRPKRKPVHPYPRKAGPTEVNNASAAAISRPAMETSLKIPSSGSARGRSGVPSGHPELKLFGHSVAFSTTISNTDNQNQTGNDPEDLDEPLITENAASPGPSKRACASGLSMLESEHNSAADDTCLGTNKCVSPMVPLSEHQPCNGPELHDHHRNLAGRCYPNLLEATPPVAFLPWQPAAARAAAAAAAAATAAAAWPNGGVNVALRSMFLGMPPEKENASAALAAATIAAASAWWTLQGAIPPVFLAQPVGETAWLSSPVIRKDQQKQQQEPEVDNLKEVPSSGEGSPISPQACKKRMLAGTREERRVRSRSVSGSNDPEEDNQQDCPSPGSDGATTRLSLLPDEAFRTRCSNTAQDGSSSEKEKCQAHLPEDDLGSINGTSNHRTKHLQHGRAGGKSSSRSTGSEGEQRKEVSQEGRMAFQALFSHEKLPQTFYARDAHESEQRPWNKEVESSSMPVSAISDSWSSRSSSSRSGFVPYRRAVEELVLTKNKQQQQQQAGPNCGLENQMLKSWCTALDGDVVVKQG